jgi:PAS domain S-box-containing protein
MSAPALKPSGDPFSGVSLPAADKILGNISAGFFSLDSEWRFTYVNASAEQILKQSRANLIGKCIWDVYADAIGSDFHRQYQRARREQIAVTFEAFYKPLDRWVEVRAYPDGGALCVLFFDISDRKQKEEQLQTARKQAEDSLQASEERFRVFMENSPTFAWIKDEQGQHVYLSKAYEKRFGVRPEDWQGKTDFDIWPPDLAQKFRNTDLEALTSGQTTEVIEETVTPDGNRAVWWKFKFPMHDASGAKYVGGVGVDITEHRRADEALRQSEARLRLALDAARAGIWEWDLQTNENVWSDELWDLYGLEPQSCEPSYENWLKTIHPQDRDTAQEVVKAAARNGTEINLEYRVVHSNGEVRWLMSRGRPVCDVNSRALRFMGIVLDISERKKAESALIRSEKLASVGRMAASIAHEINNPLAAVMNTLFLARMDAGLPVSARQYLDVADEELKRISVITRQALGFYRESSAPATVSVAAIMDSAVEVLRSRIKAKHAAIRKEYAGNLRVLAVTGELRQVFSNLLLNSLDAIGESGTIKLRVASSRCPRNGRARVRVTVADDGGGIDAPMLPRVFEPFFTTKESLGTGLGLWISKQIIDKHGGFIRVHSRTCGAHRGTAFSIILPACA